MFTQLGDRIFRRHYEFLALNIGIVVGDDGVLIIDSRESHEAAAELASDVRAITSTPVRWVINTHWHWDHAFGNAVFPDAELWGHNRCRERLENDADVGRADARMWMPEHRWPEIDRVEVVPPSNTFEAIASIDVGGAVVRMGYHGRGHTDNDVIVHIDDVTFMGDLVEDGGAPYMGDGYLLDWPATVEIAGRHSGDVIVPGHGGVRDRAWMADQQGELVDAAARLREVLYEGRSVDEAAAAGPFPEEAMRVALVRGLAWAAGEK